MTAVDVVILAGGPRKVSAASAVGRPVWSLPVDASRSLLDAWNHVLDAGFKVNPHLIRRESVVLVSGPAARGDLPGNSCVDVKLESRPHRGTAGVVADSLAHSGHDDDSLVLVIQASSSPAIKLDSLFERAHSGIPEGCSGIIGESTLGRFCGLILCPRYIFREVPTVGFYDLKEQLLPSLISASATLEAACVADRARSVQTREGWLSITADWAALHGHFEERDADGDERTRIAGQGCVVHPSARTEGSTLVSSIVMDGATVEPGAVVARSIIAPGMRVGSGARVIDAIVADRRALRKIPGHQISSTDGGMTS